MGKDFRIIEDMFAPQPGDNPSCFFCDKEHVTLYEFKIPNWPEPLPPDTILAVCKECFRLPAEQKAEVVRGYVNNLRRIYNRRIIALSN